jgi:hypothetical protein
LYAAVSLGEKHALPRKDPEFRTRAELRPKSAQRSHERPFPSVTPDRKRIFGLDGWPFGLLNIEISRTKGAS